MSTWYQIDPDLLAAATSSDRAPLKVPTIATPQGAKTRWTEIMTVVGTEYEESMKDNGDHVAKITLKMRVSESYSTDRTNAGTILTTNKNINYTQLKDRANEGQYQMSSISIRQLTSLLLAAKVVADKKEIKSFGDFFAAGSTGASRLAGATVIAQIEHGPNRQGELQQEAVRFAPFTAV